MLNKFTYEIKGTSQFPDKRKFSSLKKKKKNYREKAKDMVLKKKKRNKKALKIVPWLLSEVKVISKNEAFKEVSDILVSTQETSQQLLFSYHFTGHLSRRHGYEKEQRRV